MLSSAKLAFAQAGPELVQATIEALRRHPQPPYNRPAQASGRTAQAIRYEADDESLTVYGPAHVQTLITGRGPTRGGAAGTHPLRQILAQWAQDKGIHLRGGLSYQQFGFLAARKIHQQGTALYRLGQPSRLFADILTPQRLALLKARIAAGELVAIASELRHALTT
jgi:hypothetical protein